MGSIKPIHFPKGFPRQSNSFQKKDCKKKDQKILTLVLQKMNLLEEEGSGLLASACAPEVVLQKVFERKETQQDKIFNKVSPIGIYSNNRISWLNACLQLLIFIPSLLEWTYFLPKSFDPIKDFIEKYMKSLMEQKMVDSISFYLIRHLQVENINPIFSFFYLLKKNIPIPLQIPFFLERPIENSVNLKNEFFICPEAFSVNNHSFYTFQSQFYELTAFIEKRENIQEEESYLAYLKIEGRWFQCDDHRIRVFPTRSLRFVLNSAIFCHYKRMQPDFQKILK